jgi:hypothetical protein
MESFIDTLRANPSACQSLYLKYKEKRWIDATGDVTEKRLVEVALNRIKSDTTNTIYSEFMEMLAKTNGLDVIKKNIEETTFPQEESQVKDSPSSSSSQSASRTSYAVFSKNGAQEHSTNSADSHADTVSNDYTDDQSATVESDTSFETSATVTANLETSAAQACPSEHSRGVMIAGSGNIDRACTEAIDTLMKLRTEAAYREKELEEKVSHLESKLIEVKEEVAHLKKELKQKEKEIAHYEQRNTALQLNEEEMRKKYDSAIADKQAVEESLRQLKSQLEELRSEELKTKDEVQALKAEMRAEQEKNAKNIQLLQLTLEQKIEQNAMNSCKTGYEK